MDRGAAPAGLAKPRPALRARPAVATLPLRGASQSVDPSYVQGPPWTVVPPAGLAKPRPALQDSHKLFLQQALVLFRFAERPQYVCMIV